MKSAPEQSCGRSTDLRVDFPKRNKLEFAQPGWCRSQDRQSKLQGACDKEIPWAMAWGRQARSGGADLRLKSWKPGSEIIFKRFEAVEVRGPASAMKRCDLASLRYIRRHAPGVLEKATPIVPSTCRRGFFEWPRPARFKVVAHRSLRVDLHGHVKRGPSRRSRQLKFAGHCLRIP